MFGPKLAEKKKFIMQSGFGEQTLIKKNFSFVIEKFLFEFTFESEVL